MFMVYFLFGCVGLFGYAGASLLNGAFSHCRALDVHCRVQGTGSRAQASGCRFQGTGSKVQTPGHRPQGIDTKVQGPGHRVQGTDLRAQAPGHRVQGGQAPAGVAHRLACPTICEVFLDQGLNWCPWHCKTDS